MINHKKLQEYKKAVNKALKTSRASLDKMHAQLDRNIVQTLQEKENMENIKEEAKEIAQLRILLKKYQKELDNMTLKKYWEEEDIKEYEENEADQDLLEQFTEEDIKKLPTSWDIADFFMVFNRLCDLLTKERVLQLFSDYAKKIVENRKEFDRETVNYAHTIFHFCKQYKENIFDLRDVHVWLCYKDKWEKFAISALNQIHREYLFDELQLQLV